MRPERTYALQRVCGSDATNPQYSRETQRRRRWREEHADPLYTSRSPGTDKQLAALKLIMEGKGEFTFRCGGKRGPTHRVVIRPSGCVSFPDHVGVAEILGLISQEENARSCPQLKERLQENHSAFIYLWDTLSKAPPWAQALGFLIADGEEFHQGRKNWRDHHPFDTNLQSLATNVVAPSFASKKESVRLSWEDRKSQQFTPDSTITRSINRYASNTEQPELSITLPWPEGWESFQYCRARANHGDHIDIIPTVTPTGPREKFVTPTHLAAIAVCPPVLKMVPHRYREGEVEEQWVTPPSRPVLLTRVGDDWEVAQ